VEGPVRIEVTYGDDEQTKLVREHGGDGVDYVRGMFEFYLAARLRREGRTAAYLAWHALSGPLRAELWQEIVTGLSSLREGNQDGITTVVQ
jgi:hypothetical protein